MKQEFLWLFILLIHFLGDFGLQTHEQATNKSSSDKWLFYHVGVYSIIWFLATWIWFGAADKAFAFAITTFVFHFLTDFATSRIGKPFWDKKDLHNGFVVVGFDQVLHYIQLYLTFSLISSQMIS
jgi:hypothetical protein